ncbi:MAG: hypothetical protein IJ072_01880 [Oscillospiraceae bacterium]|nr:hypothetical protein [Oscillospiraceae bacterium]
MRKFRYLTALAVILCLLLCACGKPANTPEQTAPEQTQDTQPEKNDAAQDAQKNDADEAGSQEERESSPLPQESDEELPPEDRFEPEPVEPADDTEPLDVESDELTLTGLVELVGQPGAAAYGLLGIEDGQSGNISLFGQSAAVSVSAPEGQCGALQLTFKEADIDSLRNAISEQLGKDGADSDDVTLWQYEKNHVVLYETGEGCVVDIGF